MSAKISVVPYQELGNAVVLQAVKDYRDAVKKLSRGKKNTTAERTKSECERFFQSEYFNIFTELDGKVILSQLEKEAEYDSKIVLRTGLLA